MPDLAQTLWRFSLALSRRGDGLVDIVATDGVLLGSVIVQKGRLGYVAIPGDQRHLGRMIVERDPNSHAHCMLALEHARALGVPFASALLALAPEVIDDVRACLIEQSARRLVVLCEAMRSGSAVPRFRDAHAGALELTMAFWDVYESAVARVVPRADGAIGGFFRAWSGHCTAALLTHDDAGEQVPIARRGAIAPLTMSVVDELANAVARAAHGPGRILILGRARDWSLTVRTSNGAAWLCTEDDEHLEHMIEDTRALRVTRLEESVQHDVG